ncbi:MAG: hypothetical protein WBR35_23225, partial [Anaerolineae bacterium]
MCATFGTAGTELCPDAAAADPCRVDESDHDLVLLQLKISATKSNPHRSLPSSSWSPFIASIK